MPNQKEETDGSFGLLFFYLDCESIVREITYFMDGLIGIWCYLRQWPWYAIRRV